MFSVAIVGKPNVGKSSLFNRIIKVNKAIVHDQPGITRDRIEANANWLNQDFKIIDTGGLLLNEFDYKKEIEYQVNYAIDHANIILFVVSYLDEIDQDDYYVAKLLKKKKNKKIILVLNKAEKVVNNQFDIKPYLNFGFKEPILVSTAHGIGMGNLLDLIIENKTSQINKEDTFKFCLIGKTNVGKSTLVNTILQENRVITSSTEHTTRDAIDTDFYRDKEKYTLIDTAGIRRKGALDFEVDKFAYLRVEQTINRSNLIVVVLDGTQELTQADQTIAGLAFKANIPAIIAVNKWDAVANKNEKTMLQLEKKLKQEFKFIPWAPFVFLSAKENKRVQTLFEKIKQIRKKLNSEISTKALTELVLKLQFLNNPPMFKGGRIKINYAFQVKGQIPTFVLICNNPNFLHFSYARYLENEIRKSLDLTELPITLYFKSKSKKDQKE